MKVKDFCKKHPMIFTICYTIVYFSIFLVLEEVTRPKYIIHSFFDDYIPFCEYFIIPYLLWFIFVPGTLLGFMHKDRDSFWHMAKMMFFGNMICLLIYAVFPNGVRTKHFVEADNIFSYIVNIIYYTDTPTNVCPSIHVLDTFCAHIAICRSSLLKDKQWIKNCSLVFFILVCISTVSLKQHSIIDVLASFILMFFLEKFAYRKDAREPSVAVVQ
ncbi:MAG: phosphatase PAP2 family protein [Clostridia bacterium]